jgi:hypothetical protein
MSEAEITTGAMTESGPHVVATDTDTDNVAPAFPSDCLAALNPCAAGILMPDAIVTQQGSAAGTGWLGELLRRACSFPVVLGGFLVGAVFALVRAFNVDPDLWWHIKTGELILSTHRWATTDAYSYTSASAPWMSCEWLGDIFFAAVYRIGGLRGLEALLIVLGSAVILALYGFATLRSGNCKAAFISSAVLLPLANASFNLRPQMLGYFFLILTLAALERFRQGRQRAVWMFPVLFLIWVNTHGSWIVGLGTVGLYIVSGLVSFKIGGLEGHRWTKSERLQLETVFMLSLAVIPITPYGVRLAVYPFTVALSLPISLANVIEWQVMPFYLVMGKIFLALLLGFFLAQVAFRFSWRLEELLLFLFGSAMACLHARFLLIFVPFFAPLAATILARWAPAYSREKDKYLINFALMAGSAIAMVLYFPSNSEMQERVATQFPVHALEYIGKHPVPSPLFNKYGFGGYMIESGYKTFIDGRSELFEQTGVLSDYAHVMLLNPGALQVLRAYGIRSCLIGRDDPLSTVLASLPDWRKVYSDNVSVLYAKQDTDDAPARMGSESLRARTR